MLSILEYTDEQPERRRTRGRKTSMPHIIANEFSFLIVCVSLQVIFLSVSPFPIVFRHRRSSFLDALLSLCLLLQLLKVQPPIISLTHSLTHSLSLSFYMFLLPASLLSNQERALPNPCSLPSTSSILYCTQGQPSISLPPSTPSPSLPPSYTSSP